MCTTQTAISSKSNATNSPANSAAQSRWSTRAPRRRTVNLSAAKSRTADTALDLHVIDAEGTLRLIIHHSDIDRGEPFTIREEWIDP